MSFQMRKSATTARNAVQMMHRTSVTNSAQSCGSSFMRLIFLAIVSSGFIFLFFLLLVASSTDVAPVYEPAKFPVATCGARDVFRVKVHLFSIPSGGGSFGARGGLPGFCCCFCISRERVQRCITACRLNSLYALASSIIRSSGEFLGASLAARFSSRFLKIIPASSFVILITGKKSVG